MAGQGTRSALPPAALTPPRHLSSLLLLRRSGRQRARSSCECRAPLAAGGRAQTAVHGAAPARSHNPRVCCKCRRRNQDEVLTSISQRLAMWTGLPPSHQEDMQVRSCEPPRHANRGARRHRCEEQGPACGAACFLDGRRCCGTGRPTSTARTWTGSAGWPRCSCTSSVSAGGRRYGVAMTRLSAGGRRYGVARTRSTQRKPAQRSARLCHAVPHGLSVLGPGSASRLVVARSPRPSAPVGEPRSSRQRPVLGNGLMHCQARTHCCCAASAC